MNGWEFLAAYKSLPAQQKARIVMAMLTSCLNADDRTRAEAMVDLQGFISKPLTLEKLEQMVEDNFELEM